MATDIEAFQTDLETLLRGMGARSFGTADLEELKRSVPDLLGLVPGDYRRAVVFGIRLQRAVLEGIADRPTPLYFHNYRQVNYQLDRAALVAADRIQEAGYSALAVPASQVIRKKPMSGHISHRLLGWAAGIGFVGRNNLLVHPKYGAQMRYASVLTDMPLKSGVPHTGDCGSCRGCLDACPARAIGETRDDFDLEACYRKLTEFAGMPFIGQHVCGICVRACGGADASER